MEILLAEQIKGDQIKDKNIILVDDGVATGSTLVVQSINHRTFKILL